MSLDRPGLTAFSTIPELRNAKTVSPEKEPSGRRNVSAQLAQMRAAQASRMAACMARGIFSQRFRQPGAAEASMMPRAKSPNMQGLGHARESSHLFRNRQNRPSV